MSLSIADVRFRYGTRVILDGIDLTVAAGTMTALLGPNGSGKSTLAKVVARVHRPAGGTVAALGVDLLALPRREHAKVVAYVPQSSEAPFELTVRDMVLLGRTPHIGMRPSPRDWRIVDEQIELLSLGPLRHRPLSQLSGGQAQRALVARALAQEPSVLVLDEPTSALDLRHQVETLQIVRTVTRERGVAALVAIHDLNHAAYFCDQVAILDEGRVARAGAPIDVYEPELLGRVYGLQVEIRPGDPVEVKPLLFRSTETALLTEQLRRSA